MMRRVTQLGSGQGGGRWLLMVCALWMGATQGSAQSAPTVPTTTPAMPAVPAGSVPSVAQSQAGPTAVVEPTLPGMPATQGEEVDRVVAIVNGQLILDSDVDRERRFAALIPEGEERGPYDRDQAIERLINRDLILQQVQLQPGAEVSVQAAEKDVDSLRKVLPSCAGYHCETEDGWEKFLATQGFTEESFTAMWQQRMEVLAFIELRFRMGIRILPSEIEEYYTKTMLPQYASLGKPAPPLKAIARRIQEVLLQQRVSKLQDDWLTSLRAQGSVVVFHAGEEGR